MFPPMTTQTERARIENETRSLEDDANLKGQITQETIDKVNQVLTMLKLKLEGGQAEPQERPALSSQPMKRLSVNP